MTSVSDLLCSAAYCNRETIEQYWAVRKKLDLANARFIPYWRPDCPVKALTDCALASVYVLKDRAVIVAANRLREPCSVRVKIDPTALGLRAAALRAVDERTGSPVQLVDNVLSVDVKGRNFTYVSLTANATM